MMNNISVIIIGILLGCWFIWEMKRHNVKSTDWQWWFWLSVLTIFISSVSFLSYFL